MTAGSSHTCTVVLPEELKVGISKEQWRHTRVGETCFDFQYSRWQERQSDSLAEVAACPLCRSNK